MKALKQYEIEFKGLAEGCHEFNYSVDKQFFDFCDYEEVNQASIKVHLILDKSECMLDLIFDFKGTIELPCDRCLEMVTLPVEGHNRMIVKIKADEAGQGKEEIDFVEIPEKSFKIDVQPYIYENIILALPMQILHPNDADGKSLCNPSMLKYLTEIEDSTNNENPIWGALKNIKLD